MHDTALPTPLARYATPARDLLPLQGGQVEFMQVIEVFVLVVVEAAEHAQVVVVQYCGMGPEKSH